jgi:sensor histidine kinase regulating citrate/malate metabolism
MKSFKELSIKRKFEIILGIAFFVIGLFLFFYFPSKQKSEMSASLQQKAKAIAQMVGKASSAGLLFDDASSVTTLFDVFKEMDDVDFVIVLKKDGSKFAVYNENKYSGFDSDIEDMIRDKTTSLDIDDVIAVYAIPSGNDNW